MRQYFQTLRFQGFKYENAYQTNDGYYKHHDSVYYEKFWPKASDC